MKLVKQANNATESAGQAANDAASETGQAADNATSGNSANATESKQSIGNVNEFVQGTINSNLSLTLFITSFFDL